MLKRNNRIHKIDNYYLIKRPFSFQQALSDIARRRYAVEEKLQQSKLKCEKFLLLNITTLVKFILVSFTFSVQLTCHIFIFFILGFQSSILHKLKNTLNSFETR